MTHTPVMPTLDEQLCFSLYASSRAVTQCYARVLEETGLTYLQYLVMLVLWEPAEQSPTIGQLGERLELDSATLSPVVKRLEAAGVVARRRDSADERRVLVDVTAEGERLRQRAAAVPPQIAGAMGLEIDEARELARLLGKLRGSVRAGR